MDGVNSDLRWRICGRSGWNTNRKLLFKFTPPPGCCWEQENFSWKLLFKLALFFLIILPVYSFFIFLSEFILLLLRSQDYGGAADCVQFNLDATRLGFFGGAARLFGPFEDIKDIKQNRKQRIKERVRWKDKEGHQTVEGSADKLTVERLIAPFKGLANESEHLPNRHSGCNAVTGHVHATMMVAMNRWVDFDDVRHNDKGHKKSTSER